MAFQGTPRQLQCGLHVKFIDEHPIPRFPSYIGEALDKDEPTDAEIPEWRKVGGAKPSENEV